VKIVVFGLSTAAASHVMSSLERNFSPFEYYKESNKTAIILVKNELSLRFQDAELKLLLVAFQETSLLNKVSP
jgi:hypothetical protein